MRRQTRQKSINIKCMDCAGSTKEITLCHVFDCGLWPYRCGCETNTTRYKARMERARINYAKEFEELKKMGIGIDQFFCK